MKVAVCQASPAGFQSTEESLVPLATSVSFLCCCYEVGVVSGWIQQLQPHHQWTERIVAWLLGCVCCSPLGGSRHARAERSWMKFEGAGLPSEPRASCLQWRPAVGSLQGSECLPGPPSPHCDCGRRRSSGMGWPGALCCCTPC